jgi:putative glycosyltransferase (TIGR04372 family)
MKADKHSIYYAKLKLFSKGIIIAKPNPLQFGHLALEIQIAITLAKKYKCMLYILGSRQAINPSLYQLKSKDITIISQSWIRDKIFSFLKKVHDCYCFVFLKSPFYKEVMTHRAFLKRIGDFNLNQVKNFISKVRRVYKRIYKRYKNKWYQRFIKKFTGLKQLNRLLSEFSKKLHRYVKKQSIQSYYPRKLIINPPEIHIDPVLRNKAESYCEKYFGIKPTDEIVTLHVREAGFKKGRETHDKENKDGRYVRDDNTRNADINNCIPAIKRLIEKGYKVVRIGDASMTPLIQDGVVDVATSEFRQAFIDLYVISISKFVVCSESGPPSVAMLFNIPALLINVTDPVSTFPVQKNLMLLKKVKEIKTGKIYSPNEMVSIEHLSALRCTKKFEYIENSAYEILEALHEFLEFYEGKSWEPSRRQIKYKKQITKAAMKHTNIKFVKKWGLHDGYLGEGHICKVFFKDENLGADIKDNHKKTMMNVEQGLSSS